MKIKSFFNLFHNINKSAYEYAVNSKKIAKFKKITFLCLFLVVSSIGILSTFSLSLLSSLKLAKLWIFSENVNDPNIQELLNNYVYITNTINALITLISSISSYFSFRDGYLKNRTIYRKLDFELMQYENEIGYYGNKNRSSKNVMLINRTSLILNVANSINDLKIIEEDEKKNEQK